MVAREPSVPGSVGLEVAVPKEPGSASQEASRALSRPGRVGHRRLRSAPGGHEGAVWVDPVCPGPSSPFRLVRTGALRLGRSV